MRKTQILPDANVVRHHHRHWLAYEESPAALHHDIHMAVDATSSDRVFQPPIFEYWGLSSGVELKRCMCRIIN